MPLFQKESLYKTFYMKMSLICIKIKMCSEHIAISELLCTKARFDTEAKGNLELGYSTVHIYASIPYLTFVMIIAL